MKPVTKLMLLVVIAGLGWMALNWLRFHSMESPHGPVLITPCDTTEMELVIHLQPDERAVAQAYRKITGVDVPRMRGFAAVDPVTGKHHVWIPDLRGQYDKDRIETWGHELAHVVCGKWHPDEGLQ